MDLEFLLRTVLEVGFGGGSEEGTFWRKESSFCVVVRTLTALSIVPARTQTPTRLGTFSRGIVCYAGELELVMLAIGGREVMTLY